MRLDHLLLGAGVSWLRLDLCVLHPAHALDAGSVMVDPLALIAGTGLIEGLWRFLILPVVASCSPCHVSLPLLGLDSVVKMVRL